MNIPFLDKRPEAPVIDPTQHPRVRCACGNLTYEISHTVIEVKDPMNIGSRRWLAVPFLTCKKCKVIRWMPVMGGLEELMPVHSEYMKAPAVAHAEQEEDKAKIDEINKGVDNEHS